MYKISVSTRLRIPGGFHDNFRVPNDRVGNAVNIHGTHYRCVITLKLHTRSSIIFSLSPSFLSSLSSFLSPLPFIFLCFLFCLSFCFKPRVECARGRRVSKVAEPLRNDVLRIVFV
jgi:hypothetical protein